MAVLPILRWPDDRLSTVCTPVTDDVAALAGDLLDTMYAAPGRGLAAPQVGVLLRVFVMDAGWKAGLPTPLVCINPEVLWQSPERAEGAEGCLSIPGPLPVVARSAAVRLGWTDLQGARQERLLTGFEAICAQHEFDHLDGILTLDRIDGLARAAAIARMQP